jgi:hypothetical protein
MKLIIFLLFVFVTSIMPVQLKSQIQVRQSFQSADTKPEPALFTYTKPKNKDESYLVDAAIGISHSFNPRNTLTIFGEYHRNTLSDEQQNTIQAGLSYELFTNNQYGIAPGTRAANGSTTVITVNGKYSDNKIKEIRSLQLSGEITRLYVRGYYPGAFLPNAWNPLGRGLAIEYFPAVGVEVEDRIRVEEVSVKGVITRAVSKLYVSVYPLSMFVNNRIELFGNAAFRYDIINTTDLDDRTHPVLETGVNFILYRAGNHKISIGGSYNNIDDPGSGKEKQNFWLIAFKVKY